MVFMTFASDGLFREALNYNAKVIGLKKTLTFLCAVTITLGTLFVFVGFVSLFYPYKRHLMLFGIICITHAVGSTLGLLSLERGNRLFFLLLPLFNILWIGFTFILILYFFFGETGDAKKEFNREIFLHIGLIFYIPMSIYLAVCCFNIIKELRLIKMTMIRMVMDPESEVLKTQTQVSESEVQVSVNDKIES